MAAGAAQRQRREAAAIEEQQGLLAALQRGFHGLRQPRRDEAAARRALALEVDRLDRGQLRAAKPLRQMQMRVAAALRVDDALHRRRRRGEYDRDAGLARAHHRHVTGVIARAVLLLVGGVVLLIDNDEAQVRVWQEQRRARADDHRDFVLRDTRPSPCALARRDLGMPLRRRHAEPRREAVEELPGQRDLRHQDQHLLTAPYRLGHRLEINFGLARSGHAVDQRHAEAAVRDAQTQRIRCRALRRSELRQGVVGIGRPRHRLGRHDQCLERALVDQSLDHAG